MVPCRNQFSNIPPKVIPPLFGFDANHSSPTKVLNQLECPDLLERLQRLELTID
jgi:hypothetical protein